MVRKGSRRMRRNPMTKMMRIFTTKRGMTSGMRRRMVKKMTRGSPDVEEEKESKGPTTVNNALFVGSTAELQKLLKKGISDK